MNRLAKILFHIGNSILLLIGFGHLAAHLSPPPSPVDENQRRFLELFGSTRFEMPSGEMRSYEEIMTAYSFYFIVFPIGTSLLLWIAGGEPRILRRSLFVVILMMVAIAIATLKFAILPPAVMMITIAVLFAAAILASREK